MLTVHGTEKDEPPANSQKGIETITNIPAAALEWADSGSPPSEDVSKGSLSSILLWFWISQDCGTYRGRCSAFHIPLLTPHRQKPQIINQQRLVQNRLQALSIGSDEPGI
jgi:hypothetical protein